MLFSEPKPAHDVIREKIIGKLIFDGIDGNSASGTKTNKDLEGNTSLTAEQQNDESKSDRKEDYYDRSNEVYYYL